MTRDEFRQQMKNFKKARENNPQLSYWEWKANKYQDGTDYVNDTNLPEIVVTPDRNYINQPFDQDAYNSAMLDAWGKIDQLDFLNEALRPLSGLDIIQHIGAIRNYKKGKGYWNSIADVERNLGVVPEKYDINPVTTDAINFVASLINPTAIITGINKANKINRIARNERILKRNEDFLSQFKPKNIELENRINNRRNFLKYAKEQGFDLLNSVIDPENIKKHEELFYNSNDAIPMIANTDSEAYKYAQNLRSTFNLKNDDPLHDVILVSDEFPEYGWRNKITGLSYINPNTAHDINNTFIHEVVSHGTDDLVKDIEIYPEYGITVKDLYQDIANITKFKDSNNWNEARATLNELRNSIIREGLAKDISDIKNIPDDVLNDFIESRLHKINGYGLDYILDMKMSEPQRQTKWLQSVRDALKYLPTIPAVDVFTTMNDSNENESN